ncbi:MAG: hypothetical protein JOY64_18845 [Alphaproteobacteria bacterium]|nr:hypothetical protein [Alphaproteobacteria bacterium]MBV8409693.1 hypothetical protein [Alphaproteobacteria bacterium]
MHRAMRLAVSCAAIGLFAAVSPAGAQGIGTGVSSAPKLGDMEVKAYQKIPRDKVAVQLTSDNHLARELRRQVMIRLSQRGNAVGFSGGNVMRMDVSYFDFSGLGDGNGPTLGGQPDYAPPGSNPRMDLPSNRISRRDGLSGSTATPTLRINLTLYNKDGGKVLWTASGSCAVQGDKAQSAGEAIINRIFDQADKSSGGSAGCPF